MDPLLTGLFATVGLFTRLLDAVSGLVSDRGLAVAIVIVLLVAGLFAAWKAWGAGRRIVEWLGENAVRPVVSRHGKFLDDLTDANAAIKDGVAEIKNSVQHFEKLLENSECRYQPGLTMRRRPGEASDPNHK